MAHIEVQQTQTKKKSRRPLIYAGVVIIVLIVLIAISLWIAAIIRSSTFPHLQATGKPSINVLLAKQDILYYNNGTFLIPYAYFQYNTRNITSLAISVSLDTQPSPTAIYILNWSNECAGCDNVNQFVASLNQDLSNYSLLNASTGDVQIVQQSSLNLVKPYSVVHSPERLST